MKEPVPTPETPSNVSVRSHIRRGLALVSLALASLAAIAGNVVLAQALYYIANGVAAVVCLVVVGIAHARGTEAG